MKIITPQEKLKKGLSIIERISSKSLTLPILNNILLTTEKNFLKLSATDLEIGINWWILAKIEKEGKTVVPSNLITNLINLLPNKNINIELKDNDLYIKCEKYHTKIKTLQPDDFPIIPKIKKENYITLNSSLLSNALKNVVDIINISNNRPELSGVYFLIQKNKLTVTATDSFRLGEKIIQIENNNLNKDFSVIIPQKTIKEVINIFSEIDNNINIYFSKNQVMFESFLEEVSHPQFNLTTRLIDGDYPDYKEIIPKEYKTEIVVSKDELISQIKSASLFGGRNNEIKFKVNKKEKKLNILSQNIDLGEYQSFLLGDIKGEDTEVVFNYKFILDGLNNIKSSEVFLGLNSDSGPGVIKPIGDDSYIYIVMPIKAS